MLMVNIARNKVMIDSLLIGLETSHWETRTEGRRRKTRTRKFCGWSCKRISVVVTNGREIEILEKD